ncbi:hypothetical protein PIB30_036164 [Stylosanthes scabra]|uniref:NB-ARC domain-containing protein n=1 Tax=Stylosanthes scabra TaxID=79078 RepID=A0ABU6ZBX4_9FABA|nr:hypothetical protein [Stylosanthes scabra]
MVMLPVPLIGRHPLIMCKATLPFTFLSNPPITSSSKNWSARSNQLPSAPLILHVAHRHHFHLNIIPALSNKSEDRAKWIDLRNLIGAGGGKGSKINHSSSASLNHSQPSLDDVWNEDRAKWIELRGLIRAWGDGSKIVVTTQSRSIASMMGTVPFHDLEALSLQHSLSLFLKWAFKEGEEEKYPDLVIIEEEIVRKCRGVPLAIRTLACLLFSKYEKNVWESVRDNEIWNLPQKKDDILPALKLSYDQMPSYLRKCFAMFSLFPKDFEFQTSHVVSLWNALGLLPSPSENETSRVIANRYLSELISRSFLEDVRDFGTWYYFEMHDLVHDLALYVAKDECLMISSDDPNIPESVLHLSFIEFDLFLKSFNPNLLGVRTIVVPTENEDRHMGANNEDLFPAWVLSCKYLRYLDLADSTFEILPRSICKLKHLRYLSLRNNTRIRKLPASICNLQTLEELNLSGCVELETLPEKLRKLINMGRLSITTKQSVLPEGDIANLCLLEELHIYGCDNLEAPFVDVKLPNLRFLWISMCKNLKCLPLDIHHFPQLEIIDINQCDNFEWSNVHEDMNSVLWLKILFFCMVVNFPHSLQAYANTLQTLVFLRLDLASQSAALFPSRFTCWNWISHGLFLSERMSLIREFRFENYGPYWSSPEQLPRNQIQQLFFSFQDPKPFVAHVGSPKVQLGGHDSSQT